MNEWMDGTSLRAVLPTLILECERPKKEKCRDYKIYIVVSKSYRYGEN
jgi:hypothetical protein